MSSTVGRDAAAGTSGGEGAGLLADLLREAARRWPQATLLGRRSAREEGSTTFAAMDARVDALAAGFLAAGLQPGDRVALFADNCREWLEVDQALARAGLVSVPRGTDTAAAELTLILEHSGARAMVLGSPRLASALAAETRERRVWLFGSEGRDTPEAATATDKHENPEQHESHDEHATLDDLAREGRARLDEPDGRALLQRARVAPTAPCTIVYTSGTTGRPKGVVLSHRNVTSNVLAAQQVLPFAPGKRLLSILPSWHMFERIIEYVALSRGCGIVYTDQRRLKRDMETVAPEVVAFVPRIWEVLAQGVELRLAELHGIKGKIVRTLRRWGERLATGEGSDLARAIHARLSRLLLRPLWKALGGRLELAVSGGGALPEEVDRFLLSLGLPILQGYGLTETSPVVSVRPLRGNRVRSVGPPLPGTELRLDESAVPKKEHGVGEILVRGPQVMQGYYRDEQLSKQVLLEGGWLRTGDLGSLDEDGWLYVRGRIKDTIVLCGGENVEPEHIENRLHASPYIAQAMLVGQDRQVIGAILVPAWDKVQEDHGRLAADSKELRTLLRGELDRLLSGEAGFRAIDRIGPFVVVEEPFSLDNGCMTATLKLRRHVIVDRYHAAIEALYDRG